ncbi:MAG: prepilin-type N-terminal cleavage/methylation domain-containing protein [Pseudomonadota bacterium]
MYASDCLHNQKGSTIIEAMIAIFILTFGILTVMVMQLKAIEGSATAMNRTEANNISMAILETLKNQDFTDDDLVQTTATVNELLVVATAQQLQTLIDTGKVRTFVPANLPEMQSLIQLQAGAPLGTIVDRSRISYQLAWAVEDQVLATGETLDKTVWVFMTWNSPMGRNWLQMTTIKYNNVSL